MKRSLLTAAFVAGVGMLGAQSAQAAVICSACAPSDPATYLGEHDSTNLDTSTFESPAYDEGTAIDDFFVFDITPNSASSSSANFTLLAPIVGFSGELYNDGGSVCAGGADSTCASLLLGGLIASASGQAWEIFVANLAAGRYVLRVFGTAGDPQGLYTGQIAFAPVQVPEPALLALLGLGLAAGAVSVRRRRRI
jgi:hypothetical protein